MKKFFHSTLILMFAILLSACTTKTSPTNTAIPDVFSPTPQVLESATVQPGTNEPMESFSSDDLSLCFSYPRGYTLMPNNDTVEIMAPELPGTDMRGLFWLEISDSFGRSAEVIADQELTIAAVNADRWNVTLDGELAVVLDGMPGQDLQRRVYVVHQQTLYILAFTPTRSENKAANDQMEALYTAIIPSWTWSPCSAGG